MTAIASLSKKAAKADRLLSENRVLEVTDARVFAVRGDHDTYLVVVTTGAGFCTCPAGRIGESDSLDGRPCSHLMAARTMSKRSADPFAGGFPSETTPSMRRRGDR